ncbi:MAG: hypothetical protein KDI68_10855, partial [Gammaproteobacteria bacterium]|nr:hypothetical protein [Gammaproteobacteria bacterium]
SDADWFGTDQFTVYVTDDQGGTTDQIVSITVNNVEDAPTGLPVISGVLTVGETLIADASGIEDVDGMGELSYQWLRDGTPIVGAVGATYLLVDADAGSLISVEASYTDGGGTYTLLTSNSTSAIENSYTPEEESGFPTAPTQPESQQPVDLADYEEEPETDSDEKALAEEEEPEEASEGEQIGLAARNIDPGPIDPATIGAVMVDPLLAGSPRDSEIKATEVRHPKWIDLKQLDIAPFEVPEYEPLKVPTLLENPDFIRSLDQVAREMNESAEREQQRTELGQQAAMGVTLSLSAGFVSWVLRAGSLMASFMSVVPMWKQIDPLPILGAASIKAKKKFDAKTKDGTKDVEDLFNDKKE